MARFDLNAMIRSMVASEVERQLAPYRDVLDGMSTLAGQGAGRRPGRPRRNELAAEGVSPARRARKAAKGSAERFHEGQLVRYKQGRGEFEAKILKVDLDNDALTIERTSDKKQVVRPADKVYEAA
jgi:hypothetical protein